MYDPKDIYIEKANGVFILAMVFILCHEFAHIDLGHLDTYIPQADRLLAECEADQLAVRTMLRRDGRHKEIELWRRHAAWLLFAPITPTRTCERHPSALGRTN